MHLRPAIPLALLGLALLATACSRCGAPADPPPPIPAADFVRYAAESGSDVVVVWKDGEQVEEQWFRGEPRRLRAWSITKSITALAILRLVDEGRIASLDEPLTTFFPEWRGTPKAAITLRHVLTHSTGLSESWEGFGGDFLEHARAAALEAEPGARFAYSNVPMALLGGVIAAVTGKAADAYLDEAIFAPLGIRDYDWNRDPKGNADLMGGLEIAPAELARIGELMRTRGLWRERRILSDARIAEALGPSARNERLGLLWWRPGGALALGSGVYGQYLIVLPTAGVVLVRMRDEQTHEPSEVGDRLLQLAIALDAARTD